MSAIHYSPGGPNRYPMTTCERFGFSFWTASLDSVTCKRCLARAQKLGLRDRSNFPDVPTFHVTPSGKGQVKFTCPVCGKTNYHGKGDGHRAAHCGCWERGYILDGAK